MNHPLRQPSFRALFLSRAAGNLAVAFSEIPLMWWVLEKTGQASLVATVALLASLGTLLAAPLGGILADWGSRKRQILLTYGGDLAIQALFIAGVLGGWLSLGLLDLLVLGSYLLSGLRQPAVAALQPALLKEEQYQAGNASMGLAFSLALLVSYSLAGVATGALGVVGALALGEVIIFLGAIFLLPLKEPERLQAPCGQQGIWNGVRFVLQSRLLSLLVGVAMLLNLVFAPLSALLAPLARLLGSGAAGYGWLSAAFFAGQILSMAVLNFVSLSPATGLFLGSLFGGCAVVGLSQAGGLPVGLSALFVAGLATGVANVQVQTLLQKLVPLALMGRVMGTLQGLLVGIQPVGLALTSLLVGHLGVRRILLAAGAWVTLAAFLWLLPGFRLPRVQEV